MISWGSDVTNGQLVTRAPSSAFHPMTYGAAYTGPGFWPRQGVYGVPPVVPSAGLQAAQAPASASGNTGGAGSTDVSATSETGNPFHLTKSPLPIAAIGLIVAYLMLHYVHW